MSQIERKWIANSAVDPSKIDSSSKYTVAGLISVIPSTGLPASIGIGTTNPLDQLHIRDTSGISAIRLQMDDGVSGRSFQLTSDQAGNFNIRDAGFSQDRVTVDASGRVGVGTTDPQSEVHVYGADARVDIQNSSGNDWRFDSSSTGSLNVVNATAGAVRVTVDAAGKVGVGTTAPVVPLHVVSITGDAAIRVDADAGAGKAYDMTSSFVDGSWKLVDVDAGLDRLVVGSAGNLTIKGDTTMEGGLQVQGTVTVVNQEIVVSGQMQLNNSADTSALGIKQFGGTSRVVWIDTTSTGPAVVVTGSGNHAIGLGTTSPSGEVHAYKDQNTATMMWVQNPNVGASAYAGFLAVSDTASVQMSVKSSGAVPALGIPNANLAYLYANNNSGFLLNNTTATPIYLATNGSIKMTVLSGGNVGIGTTTPAYLLSAYTDTDANVSIRVNNPNAGISAGALVSADSNTAHLGMYTYSSGSSGTNAGISAVNMSMLYAGSTNTKFLLNQAAAAPMYFATSDTVRMTILSGGSVGIGTLTPGELLTLYKATTGGLRIDTANSFIDFWKSGVQKWTIYNSQNVTDDLAFISGGTTKFTLLPSGDVGIGTTNPSSVLHVYGTSETKVLAKTSSSTSAAFFESDADTTNTVQMIAYGTAYVGTESTVPKSDLNLFTGKGSALLIEQMNNAPIYMATNSTVKMTVLGNGNVGIGTSNPKKMFHVYGGPSGTSTPGWSLADASSVIEGSTKAFLQIQTATDGTGGIKFGSAANSNSGVIRYYAADNKLTFGAISGADRLSLTSGGTVGIGTTNPSETLSIIQSISSAPRNVLGVRDNIGTLIAAIGYGGPTGNSGTIGLYDPTSPGIVKTFISADSSTFFTGSSVLWRNTDGTDMGYLSYGGSPKYGEIRLISPTNQTVVWITGEPSTKSFVNSDAPFGLGILPEDEAKLHVYKRIASTSGNARVMIDNPYPGASTGQALAYSELYFRTGDGGVFSGNVASIKMANGFPGGTGDTNFYIDSGAYNLQLTVPGATGLKIDNGGGVKTGLSGVFAVTTPGGVKNMTITNGIITAFA